MAAYRCSTCTIDWPANHAAFAACRSCDAATSYVAEAEGLSLEEAWPLARRMDFERFYAERGEREADLSYIDRGIAEVDALKSIPVLGEPIPVEPLPPEHFGKDAHLLDR